jgi:hypothetical protein
VVKKQPAIKKTTFFIQIHSLYLNNTFIDHLLQVLL